VAVPASQARQSVIGTVGDYRAPTPRAAAPLRTPRPRPRSRRWWDVRGVGGTVNVGPRPSSAPRRSAVVPVPRPQVAAPVAAPRITPRVTSTTQLNILQTRFARPSSGGRSLGGFLQNLGAGAADTVRALPAGTVQLVKLASQATRYPIVRGLDEAGRATGLSGRNSFVARQRRSTEQGLAAYGRAIKDDYSYRYGPLVRGDVRTFGSRFYDNPLPTLLDAGAAYALAGKSITGAAQSARKVGVGSEGGRLDRTARNAITGVRARPPRQLSLGNTADRATGVNTVDVYRRPYSSNPITRSVQRQLTPRLDAARDSLAARAQATIDRAPTGESGNPVSRMLSEQARHDRAHRSTTLRQIDTYQARAGEWFARNTLLANHSIRRLRPSYNQAGVRQNLGRGMNPEEVAVSLHARGLLPKLKGPENRPTQIRDRIVAKWESELGDKPRTSGTRRNIEAVQAVPDYLLDLDSPMPTLTAAEQAARARVQRALGSMRQTAEVVEPQVNRALGLADDVTAQRRTLSSRMVLAGARNAEDVVAGLVAQERSLRSQARAAEAAGNKGRAATLRAKAKRAKAQRQGVIADSQRAGSGARVARLRAQRSAAVAQLREAEAAYAATVGQAQAALAQGRQALGATPKPSQGALFMGGRRFQIGAAAQRRRQQPQWRESPAGNQRIVGPGDVTPTGKNKRGTGGTVARRRDAAWSQADGQQLSGIGARYTFRTRQAGLDAAKMRVANLRVQLARAQGQPAAVAAARRKLRQAEAQLQREMRGNLGFTRPTNTGAVNEGIYIPDNPVDAPVGAAPSRISSSRGFGPQRTPQSTGRLIEQGNVSLDPRVMTDFWKRISSRVAGPMSARSLDELVNRIAFMDDSGRRLSGDRAVQKFRSDPERVALINAGSLQKATGMLDDLPEGRGIDDATMSSIFLADDVASELLPAKDVIAVSRAAADTWRDALGGNPRGAGQVYDTVMDYWRGGLLALSPRWYVNNLLGNAAQYALLSAGDLRAIRDLRRANRDAIVRDRVPAEVTQGTFINEARLARGSRIEELFDIGYGFNQRIEAAWRRAAYYQSARRNMRREGVNLNKLDGEELGRALDDMPTSVKEQAIRDVELFLGNFSRMSRFERTVLRRIFPFYAWAKVISRLTFTLPFRSPLRAQALNQIAFMGMYANPDDPDRFPNERGAIAIPDGVPVIGGSRLQTGGLNPFATIAPFMEQGLKSQNLSAPFAATAGWQTPVLQAATGQFTGVNPFTGSPYTAPGISQDTVGQFGRGRERYNPVTRMVEGDIVSPSAGELLFQSTFPVVASPLRRVLAGGERPFDTTPTLPFGRLPGVGAIPWLGTEDPSLLDYRLGGAGRNEVMLPRAPRASAQFGSGSVLDSFVGATGGAFGFPLRVENLELMRQRRLKREADFRRAWAKAEARARAGANVR